MRAGVKSFIAAFVVLAIVAPVAAQAAERKIPRIGFFSYYTEERTKLFAAFEQGMRDLGYVAGENVIIDVRHADGVRRKVPTLIAELLGLNPDVIVAGALGAEAAAKMTRDTPVVLTYSANPVRQGLVTSLAHPGTNVTGLSDFHGDLIAKRVELLKEITPSATSIAVIFNPARSSSRRYLKRARTAAAALGLKLLPLPVKKPDDFGRILATLKTERPAGILQAVGLGMYRKQIINLAAQSRLPAIYTRGQWVSAGGLLSYGASWPDLFRRAATYVDKILKGARPGELPVEQPAKFELILNLKTAQTLGITIPSSILLRTDEVIE